MSAPQSKIRKDTIRYISQASARDPRCARLFWNSPAAGFGCRAETLSVEFLSDSRTHSGPLRLATTPSSVHSLDRDPAARAEVKARLDTAWIWLSVGFLYLSRLVSDIRIPRPWLSLAHRRLTSSSTKLLFERRGSHTRHAVRWCFKEDTLPRFLEYRCANNRDAVSWAAAWKAPYISEVRRGNDTQSVEKRAPRLFSRERSLDHRRAPRRSRSRPAAAARRAAGVFSLETFGSLIFKS